MTSLILAGLGIAGTALALRVLSRNLKQMQQHASKISRSSSAFTTYYRGGFEPKMTRREAGLILGKRNYLLNRALLPHMSIILYYSMMSNWFVHL